jgi:hypothetical protein
MGPGNLRCDDVIFFVGAHNESCALSLMSALPVNLHRSTEAFASARWLQTAGGLYVAGAAAVATAISPNIRPAFTAPRFEIEFNGGPVSTIDTGLEKEKSIETVRRPFSEDISAFDALVELRKQLIPRNAFNH